MEYLTPLVAWRERTFSLFLSLLLSFFLFPAVSPSLPREEELGKPQAIIYLSHLHDRARETDRNGPVTRVVPRGFATRGRSGVRNPRNPFYLLRRSHRPDPPRAMRLSLASRYSIKSISHELSYARSIAGAHRYARSLPLHSPRCARDSSYVRSNSSAE